MWYTPKGELVAFVKGAPGPPGALLFDSEKEAKRWPVLLKRLAAGEIQALRRQRIIRIYAGEGKLRERVCNYEADFTYVEGGKWIVEDVKSEITRRLPVYRLKLKLLRAICGIEIREV